MTRATGARGEAGPGRVLAIASGKGGVGKTWLAVSLAQALAEAGGGAGPPGGRVLLMDCDHGLANVDVQLGLDPARDLSDVLTGRLRLAEAALAHPAGFDVLPGRSGSGALATLDAAAVGRLLDAVAAAAAGRGGWGTVVLDLGAGIDLGVRRLAAAADTLLVVATEEPTSLTDAYAVLKLHRRDRPGGDARVVVNQAADRAAGERTWRALDRACLGFLGAGAPLAGVVRRDARVPEAIRRQTPLLTRHPASAAAEDVRRLAAALDHPPPASGSPRPA